jgi:hypothetical protein
LRRNNSKKLNEKTSLVTSKETTMAFAHSALTTGELYTAAAKPAHTGGFFRHLLRAMQAARLRQAEREIGLYLARSGGKFTDESERDIERRFLSNQRW